MVAQYEDRDILEDNNTTQHCYGSIISENDRNGDREQHRPLVPVGNDAKDECTTPALLKDTELLQDEIKGMTKLAIPVIITYLLEMFPGIVTIILVGRVEYNNEIAYDMSDNNGALQKKLHLDAASLSVMFINVVALSPAFGLLTAMDTLCSQAHGASQPQLMGTYSLTGIVVISIVFLLSTIIIWNTSTILIHLGQPIEVSNMAASFILYMLPGVPFLYLYELIRKVGQSRNEVMPMLVSAIVSNLVNGIVGYYLVHGTDWGWEGAAIARSVGNVVTVPTVILCMMREERKDESGKDQMEVDDDEWGTQRYLEVDNDNRTTEHGMNGNDIHKENETKEFLKHLLDGFVISEGLSVQAIVEFLTLGFPGMLQVMFEWVAFEVIILLCGILPGQEAIIGIGANSIIMNVSSLTYMLYLGASVSGNVRVGNALGAGDEHRAEIASNLTLATGFVMSIINVTLLLSFRMILPYFFTTDIDIIEKAQHLFLIAAAFQLPDAMNGCVQGIFRGSGRQSLAAIFNFVAYYIIGIPVGYVLGIRLGFGVEGLWIGMTIGLCVIAIGCTIIVLRSDWKRLSFDATLRLSK